VGTCGSLAAPTITILDPSLPDGATHVTQTSFISAGGTFDIAEWGSEVVAAFVGHGLSPFEGEQSGEGAIRRLSLSEPTACDNMEGEFIGTAVVALSSFEQQETPRVLMQTLAPASLIFMDSGDVISLDDDASVDTGMLLFHTKVGPGLACTSCHPMGRTDNNIWAFQTVGPRRTQSLEGGVSKLGAFHWEGKFETFGDFVDDVMTVGMGLGETVPGGHKQALLRFIDSIPRAVVDHPVNEQAAARGKLLFEDEVVGCAECHNGPLLTDNEIYDVNTGGPLVTPPLVGIRYRLPIMHDGCAATLEERFGLCGGGDAHGQTSHLDGGQIADLVAYLETL
jgi:mono/diheme cytochrome c family protein